MFGRLLRVPGLGPLMLAALIVYSVVSIAAPGPGPDFQPPTVVDGPTGGGGANSPDGARYDSPVPREVEQQANGEQVTQDLMQGIVRMLRSVLRAGYSIVASWVTGTFAVAVTTLYIVIVGYICLTGRVGDKWPKWAMSALLLSAITGLLDDYWEWVIDPAWSTAVALLESGASISLDGYENKSSLTAPFDEARVMVDRIVEQMSSRAEEQSTGVLPNMDLWFAKWVLQLVFFVLYVLFFVVVLTTLFTLSLLLLIGPIPVFFAIFPGTRFICWSWLRAIVTEVVTLGLIGFIVGIVIGVMFHGLRSMESKNGMIESIMSADMAATLLIMILGIVFLKSASDIAAKLTGGAPSPQNSLAGGAAVVGAGMWQTATQGAMGRSVGSFMKERALPGIGGAAKAGGSRAWSAMKGFGGR